VKKYQALGNFGNAFRLVKASGTCFMNQDILILPSNQGIIDPDKNPKGYKLSVQTFVDLRSFKGTILR
jgi:hypothetical protein